MASLETGPRPPRYPHKEIRITPELFMGETIPEAHQLTGYGLFLAGTEYFDHLRKFQTQESYVKRTLLTDSKEKATLRKTINELVAA